MSRPVETSSELPTPVEVMGLCRAELLGYQPTMGNQAVQDLLFLDVWTWEAKGEGRPSPWDVPQSKVDEAA